VKRRQGHGAARYQTANGRPLSLIPAPDNWFAKIVLVAEHAYAGRIQGEQGAVMRRQAEPARGQHPQEMSA
jgi:hypothetical protein